MRVLLLGPFRLHDDEDRPVEITGTRLRALLARLAMSPGREVPVDSLTDAIWGDEPPSPNALQALVSRVRRVIGGRRLVHGPAGYRLDVGADDVDVARFERLCETGRRHGDLAALREAAALWRGPALTDLLEYRFAEAAGIRLEGLRREAARDRIAREIASGVDVLTELEPLAAAHPLDERWQALLIRAWYAAGRQADALSMYEQVRERLADELGVDPSPELAELHLQILRREQATATPVRGRRTNLKAHLTSFIGREDDLAAVAAALSAGRLVTVTGPGGAGKTRLVTELAARADSTAPDGTWLVELVGVAEPGDVAPAILRAIGAREAGLLEPSALDAAGRLVEYFADQRALLILDNCEHQVAAVAESAVRLLRECPGLRILATSRAALTVDGERLYPLPALPGDGADAAAVRLFRERAAAVRPGFTLDEASTPVVVEICRRLDGIPLAIELAASRMRALDAAQIAARLDDRFALLAGGNRAAPERHRTLRAVIEWSWELLSPAERDLATTLSVFPGGVTLDRVGDFDVLAGLIDKSFMERDGDRYRMSETIRSYAREQLAAAGNAETVALDRMVRYCLELVETSDTELRGAGQLGALSRLDAEHDNLLAALRVAHDGTDPELGVRLAVALFWYWHLRGLHTERLHWTGATVMRSPGLPPRWRPAVLALTGMARCETGDFSGGARLVTEAFAAARTVDDPPGRIPLAVAPAFLTDPGIVDTDGRPGWERGMALLLSVDTGVTGSDAMDRVMRARDEFDRLGDRWGMANTLRIWAEHRSRHGDREAARDALSRAARHLDELGTAADAAETYAELAVEEARAGARDPAARALALAAERADTDRERRTLAYVGWADAQVRWYAGEHEEALRRLDTVEPGFDGTALEPRIRVWCAAWRSFAAVLRGDTARARRQWHRLPTRHIEAAAGPDLAVAARLHAAIAVADGEPETAAYLLGVAAALLGTDDRRGYDAALRTPERTRAAMRPEAFQAAYDRGAARERGTAIALLTVTSGGRTAETV
ncbi:putative ATPase [Stackebrandtia albiflava]|uniref:Putative ATPase n=1 Tax=Stackebrandtia albiflava TaxID=406432 RepID=A0A562V272_9ACTN|nr:BTAD domain-containing putative transcriptional regulator [Stackebrandtia albiflava]TWJ11971.1 putative ATPase [Stackebrandtia albiflava]